MPSLYRKAFTELSNWAVTVEHDDPEIGTMVYEATDLNTLKDSYTDADLPIRVLLPWEPRGADGSALEFRTKDRGAEAQWLLVDMLIYKEVGDDLGVSAVAPLLAEYAGAYLDQIRAKRFLATDGQHTIEIDRVTINIDVNEYPRGSHMVYFTVVAMIRLKEFLTLCS